MINYTVALYRNAYSGLSRQVWLLSLVMLINRSGTMVLAFLTLYCTHKGFTLEQAGMVVGIYGIGSVVGALIGGKLSDAFGFYLVQCGALFFGGLLFLLLGQVDTFRMICIVTFFLSMVNESFRPANSAAIAEYSTPQNRTQSYSLVRLAVNVGWGVGAALGGLLASIDYSLLFWVDGFTNIAGAGMLLLLIPYRTAKPVRRESTVQIAGRSPYTDKTFLMFLLFMLLFAICFFQLFSSVPVYFKQGLGLDEFWIGVVMASNGIMIAVVEMVLVYKLEGRAPYLRFMMLGAIIMAISFAMLNLPLEQGFLIAAAFTFMLTISEMVAMPFMNSYYIARSAEHNRGQYAGMYTMAWSVAQVIGSTSGTFIAHRLGFSALWWIIITISLLSAAGYAYLLKRN